ncbi:hypothetical protein PR202_ga30690 [Eleusine coracana subsp. coracana]|uniref:Uncharacterized protein n=1 Tax=Eleusine coracana subsp. coracana TaxID=191504 RepID=A0AAV5DR77_ELECO|nr:hypothetical protein PR202_ga30690 [Eleusine coracana subsp. coracana]
MAREEATGDMSSGSDGDHGCCSDDGGEGGGGEGVSGVTEVGTSGGNAAAKARWGGAKDWMSTLITEGEEAEADAGDEEEEEEKASSPAWLLAARLGWLLLGFIAGAALATTVLLLTHDGYPETCIVPT